MAYTFNRSDGTPVSVANDAIDNTYSLGLVGRNAVDYGLTIAKNTVLSLENFAASTPPSGTPLRGQIWYDSVEGTMRVYDGSTWKRSTAIPVANTAPSANVVAGTAYFDSRDDQLYVYAESEFKPAVVPGGVITNGYSAEAGVSNKYGTKVETLFLTPTSGSSKAVLALKYVSNGTDNPGKNGSTNETIMAIISDHESFSVANTDPYYNELSASNSIGATVGKGLTLRGDYADSTVENANIATYANYAFSVDTSSTIPTSGAIVGASDLFHPAKNLIPDSDSNYTVGTSTNRYLEMHADTIYAGAGGASGGGILFNGTEVTIGNVTQGAKHIYTEDLTVTGDITMSGVNTIGDSGNPIESGYFTALTITGTAIAESIPSSDSHIANKKYVDDEITVAAGNYVQNTGTETIDGNKTFSGTTVFQAISGTTASFTTFDGVATEAQYADLAEIYKADAEYAPGTVVKLGGSEEITQTTAHNDINVFGVISTDPAYLMNSKAEGLAVAMTGRVPVKVIGKVKKGERLVSSDVPGVAWALADEAYDPRAIIGRSLQDKENGEEGIVEAVVGVK